MKNYRIIFITWLALLTGCADEAQEVPAADKSPTAAATAPKHAATDTTWQPSTLPAETIDNIHALAQDYQRCLSEEWIAFPQKDMDLRHIADIIMKHCEPSLKPMREAFLQAHVDAALADRYLTRQRHQAAQSLIRVIMFEQANAQAFSQVPHN